MRGEANPKWTAGREAWLAKLAAAPARPHGVAEGSTATYCRALSWTTRGALEGVRGSRDMLTDAGRAVLAEWQAGNRQVCKRSEGRPPRGTPFEVRIGFALKDGGLEALADWLVFTGQAGELGRLVEQRLQAETVAAQDFARIVVTEELATSASERLYGGARGGGKAFPCGFEPGGPAAALGPRAGEVAAVVLPPTVEPLASFGASTLGLRAAVPEYLDCESCHGKGRTGRDWMCHTCQGSGKLKRTVEL